MKVTEPMIDRAMKVAGAFNISEEQVTAILRAALRDDPQGPPHPLEGQMTVDDFPEVYA